MNEKNFRDLISGKTQGAAATLARGGLRLLSPFYSCGVRLRNAGFCFGINNVHRGQVPVVSIGNLTTGGTGKTPFAAFLAHWFRDHGRQVCFLSRGYRAESGQVNDEARVLEQLCPDIPHLQNPNRVASAQTAVTQFNADLLILDDGFQHRRLHRDLDIALIDAVNPWGYGYLLPRGLLREPRTGLRRADVVVITRVDQVDEDRLAAIRRQIGQYTHAKPVEISFPPVRLINAVGQTAEINSLHGLPLAVFCGIGNPTAFQAAIESLGLTIAAFREFPDHHPYGNDDITQLKHWVTGANAAAALVTQKDLVKLDMTDLEGIPLWALEIGCKIHRGGETLFAALNRLTQSSTASDSAEA